LKKGSVVIGKGGEDLHEERPGGKNGQDYLGWSLRKKENGSARKKRRKKKKKIN